MPSILYFASFISFIFLLSQFDDDEEEKKKKRKFVGPQFSIGAISAEMPFAWYSMEETEAMTADMFKINDVKRARIESNNGGRGFARAVGRLVPSSCGILAFHQSENKESRILTHETAVTQNIIFPENWNVRWPEFAEHVTKYKRMFKANKHDDAADALTGVIEKSLLGGGTTKRVKGLA